jgi:hypothetical protein
VTAVEAIWGRSPKPHVSEEVIRGYIIKIKLGV